MRNKGIQEKNMNINNISYSAGGPYESEKRGDTWGDVADKTGILIQRGKRSISNTIGKIKGDKSN